MYRVKHSVKLGLFAAIFMVAGLAAAEEHNPVQAHGFISQGFTATSDNNFFGNSDNGGSFAHTEAALSLSKNMSPNVFMAGQVSIRQAGETDEVTGFDDANIDYALIDFSTTLNSTIDTGVRLGRIRNPIGFYSETRDAVFTRGGVFLPQSIYFDALGFRNLLLSSDGAQLYASSRNNIHNWSAHTQIAEPRDSETGPTTEITGLRDPSLATGKLSGKPMAFMRLGYNYNNDVFRAFITGVKYKRDYQANGAATATNAGAGKVDIDMSILSLEYNQKKWSVSSEIALIDINRQGFEPVGANSHDILSWYLRGLYRLNDKLNITATTDHYYLDRNDKKGANQPIPHLSFAHDYSIGLQWTIYQNWYLATEAHYIEGTSWLSAEDNPNLYGLNPGHGQVGGEKYWTMFATMLSYRF